MKELIVENNDNIRLDSYIANENSDLSRAVIQKLLEDGNILVNDVNGLYVEDFRPYIAKAKQEAIDTAHQDAVNMDNIVIKHCEKFATQEAQDAYDRATQFFLEWSNQILHITGGTMLGPIVFVNSGSTVGGTIYHDGTINQYLSGATTEYNSGSTLHIKDGTNVIFDCGVEIEWCGEIIDKDTIDQWNDMMPKSGGTFYGPVIYGERTIDGAQLKWSVFHDFPADRMYSVFFIKRLHIVQRLLRTVSQQAVGIALERGEVIKRRRIFGLFLARDFLDRGHHLLSAPRKQLFSCRFFRNAAAGCHKTAGQFQSHRVEFFRHKGGNGGFALHRHGECRGHYSAHRQRPTIQAGKKPGTVDADHPIGTFPAECSLI